MIRSGLAVCMPLGGRLPARIFLVFELDDPFTDSWDFTLAHCGVLFWPLKS